MVSKICAKCKIEKPVEEFPKTNRNRSGIGSRCLVCTKEQRKQIGATYYKNNIEKCHDSATKWRSNNKEAVAAIERTYRLNHPEQIKTKLANYAKNNSDKINANQARRKARLLLAIPAWVNFDLVEEFYAEARYLSSTSPTEFHVDHIVPLQSDIVCGLHWEGNLQVLSEFDNISKGNRFWPNMPTNLREAV